MNLKVIKNNLLDAYCEEFPNNIELQLNESKEADLSTPNFSFYTSVASVFSSKIEGENIELDSYIKHKRDGIQFQKDYTKKIDDLYNAYIFAQNHPLTPENIFEIHKILSQHILEKHWQGKYRHQNMYVASENGNIEYVAALPQIVPNEMDLFYNDLKLLLETKLNIESVFFYAAMLHLVFVKIHPWNDGNGRTARLIEKWFLAQKLGEKAWFIQSEKMYYNQHQAYYNNLRQLGLEYELLDFTKALPFLKMLPKALFE